LLFPDGVLSHSYLTIFALWLITDVMAGAAGAQTLEGSSPKPSPAKPAVVQAVGVEPGKDGPALEIITSTSLAPAIHELDGPPRLVVDLAHAITAVRQNRLDYHDDSIAAIRIDQYESSPPVTRIVVDLRKPVSYTWDVAGNRLMIRLHSGLPAVVPGAAALSPASLVGTGQVVLANSRIAPGSSVTAGSEAAVLNLGGGQVRVCPGTTVSLTTSSNGRDLLLGMSTGSLETHYSLRDSSDSVLTPDFRILLSGPGEFDYAISADTRGTTCVRSLPGNGSPVFVAELIGEDTYSVQPGEQAVFRFGRLQNRDHTVPGGCGCPGQQTPVLTAEGPGAEIHPLNPSASMRLATPEGIPEPAAPGGGATTGAQTPTPAGNVALEQSLTAPLPQPEPNEVHIQVEAPMVYRATEPAESGSSGPPLLLARQLPVHLWDPPPLPATIVMPPSDPAPPKPHRGFFGRVKGFLAAMVGAD
jgi:hypothetical protein